MECKFASNGLSISYDGTVKPCCVFRTSPDWRDKNHLSQVDLVSWHQSPDVKTLRSDLARDQWPVACSHCAKTESRSRGDSMRLNGANAYGDYRDQDITLEIRPGNTCNFACQTCWPEASSRVTQFYQQAGLPTVTTSNLPWDYHAIQPIAHRLRDIVILGGEPFYDKRCRSFLTWLLESGNQANIIMFTNGSMIDRLFLERYRGKITLVFSLDARGRPAEYIRFGTVWQDVMENYLHCRSLGNVETRVNITTSVYNYAYLQELLEWLCEDWPAVVSFGDAGQSRNSTFMAESSVPWESRPRLLTSLQSTVDLLQAADIEAMQKINAINAINVMISNLRQLPFDQQQHQQLSRFINAMDQVKHIDIWDYCPETAEILDIRPGILHKDSPVFFTGDK